MSAQVKYYNTAIHTGLAGYTQAAGTLIALLKTIAVDGFNSSTISTMTWAAGVVSVYVSTGHGFLDKQVVLIAGANEAGYNGEFVLTYVDANNFTYAVAATLTTPSTGTRTCKTAPLGWTREFNSTDIEVFRAPDGLRPYVRFYEPTSLTVTRGRPWPTVVNISSKFLTTEMYASMTGHSTGVMNAETYIHKMRDSITQTNRLIVVGNGSSMYILTQNEATHSTHNLNWCGQFLPFDSADQYCMGLLGKYGGGSVGEDPALGYGSSTISHLGTVPTTPQLILGGDIHGRTKFLKAHLTGMVQRTLQGIGLGGQQVSSLGFCSTPAFPVFIRQQAEGYHLARLRGRLPGIYNAGWHSKTYEGYLPVSNISINGASANGLMVDLNLGSSNIGGALFDTTGPWV